MSTTDYQMIAGLTLMVGALGFAILLLLWDAERMEARIDELSADVAALEVCR